MLPFKPCLLGASITPDEQPEECIIEALSETESDLEFSEEKVSDYFKPQFFEYTKMALKPSN